MTPFRKLAALAAVLGGATAVTTAAQAAPAHWSLAIHGGAGVVAKGDLTPQMEKDYRAGLKAALAAGSAVLEKGGSSVDAVEAAVKVMEDDPLFNAGKGAVYTATGTHALDAAIMNGADGKAGAVAGVSRTRNPIMLARAVMDKTRFVLLSSAGADQFSKLAGLAQVDPHYYDTPARMKDLEDWRKDQAVHNKTHLFGTVGAVALDERGHLAAATSTGGLTGNEWGRIGDSPQIGSGTFAEDKVCAVSATGTGEYFIRQNATRQVCDRIEWNHQNAQQAADATLDGIAAKGGDGGLIVVDSAGTIAFSIRDLGMYRGWATSDGRTGTAIYPNEPGPE